MGDGFEYFIRFTLWLTRWATRLMVVGTSRMLNLVLTRTQVGKPHPVSQKDEREDRRLAGCEEVVKYFLTGLGFIAREAISREELEKLIDQGIQPEALRKEIHRRIEAVPGIVLGRFPYGDAPVEFKLPNSLRDRHCYIVGRSGSGKTVFLQGCIMQDLAQGNGIGVLAPEAELIVDEILPYIPDERIDDVIYVNPADTEYPVSINPLHVDVDEDIDKKVEDFVAIFKRAVGDTKARMDEILNQTLYALMSRPGSTLLDIEPLLSRENTVFRNQVLKTADERTRSFFLHTYPRMDKNAHIPIVNRINAFLRRKSVRSLLCQPGRSLNFRTAIDEGKILLYNVSDGMLGQQTAQLLGELIVSKIQMAVMSRANISKTARRPFYLYLDEFQAFVGVNAESYSMLLERSRKYAFGLVLAHQQTEQIPLPLLKQIFGNVTTMITFNVSSEDARRIAQEYVLEDEEHPYLPPQEFLRLKRGEALAKIDRTVFPLKTSLVDQPPNHLRAKEVIERSRYQYGTKPDTKWPEDKPEPPDDDLSDDPSEVF